MTTHTVDLSKGLTELFFAELEHLADSHPHVRKRLTEITIELFQNIRKHAVRANHNALFIQQENSTYLIASVNMVTARQRILLQDRIRYINTLDQAQHKVHHTKILSRGTRSKKCGAGLAFFRIAMRSASALVPVFRQLDQKYFTFHFTLP